MIRYILILILAILLGISSYLLYNNKYVTVNIETGSREISSTIVQGGTTENTAAPESERTSPSQAATPKATSLPDIKEEIETLEDDSQTQIHLEPTVGIDINPEQRIASSYKAIGPREFVLLTNNEKPMVEIDLDTGQVTINPDYDLNEVSTEFWKSIGNKYPEVCFIE